MLEELQAVQDLRFDLVSSAEDVCIVLLEASHPRQPSQGAAELISVQDSEVGELDRQLLVRVGFVLENQAVPWAVHGLQSLRLAWSTAVAALTRSVRVFQKVQVVLVVLVMARGLPQVDVVEIGRHDLLEASLAVLEAHELHELVVDLGAVWQEEGAAWREWTEEEELLVLPDDSVIATLCFFLELQVLSEFRLAGK